MSSTLQIVVASVAMLVMLLGWLARRHPEARWLRAFNLRDRLTPAQQRELKRSSDVAAGMQLILLGIVVALGYVALTVMLFNEFTTGGVVLVTVCSLGCIVAGVIGIGKSNAR